jgi:hypothetical protein
MHHHICGGKVFPMQRFCDMCGGNRSRLQSGIKHSVFDVVFCRVYATLFTQNPKRACFFVLSRMGRIIPNFIPQPVYPTVCIPQGAYPLGFVSTGVVSSSTPSCPLISEAGAGEEQQHPSPACFVVIVLTQYYPVLNF